MWIKKKNAGLDHLQDSLLFPEPSDLIHELF